MTPDTPKPFWATKTFWTSIVGIVTSGGAVLALILRKPEIAVGAASLAAFLGNLGSMFARQGAIEAAKTLNDSGDLTQREGL